jgi:hypothetical protein
MEFKQFQHNITSSRNGYNVKGQIHFGDVLVSETVEGIILIDNQKTDFNSLVEAMDSLKAHKLQRDIEDSIQSELYEDLTQGEVAQLIREHHDVRVTEAVIEDYILKASTKHFSIDPVLVELRDYNIFSKEVNPKIDFILIDGSKVAIEEETYAKVQSVLSGKPEAVAFMRESLDNFLDVINVLEKY